MPSVCIGFEVRGNQVIVTDEASLGPVVEMTIHAALLVLRIVPTGRAAVPGPT